MDDQASSKSEQLQQTIAKAHHLERTGQIDQAEHYYQVCLQYLC